MSSPRQPVLEIPQQKRVPIRTKKIHLSADARERFGKTSKGGKKSGGGKETGGPKSAITLPIRRQLGEK